MRHIYHKPHAKHGRAPTHRAATPVVVIPPVAIIGPPPRPKLKVNPLPEPHPHKGIAQEISDRLEEMKARFVKNSRMHHVATESLTLLAMLVKEHPVP